MFIFNEVYTLQFTALTFEKNFSCYFKEFHSNPSFSEFSQSQSSTLEPHAYRTFAYDGVWTMAIALDKAEKELQMANMSSNLTNLSYFKKTNVADLVIEYLKLTNFIGVSVSLIHTTHNHA